MLAFWPALVAEPMFPASIHRYPAEAPPGYGAPLNARVAQTGISPVRLRTSRPHLTDSWTAVQVAACSVAGRVFPAAMTSPSRRDRRLPAYAAARDRTLPRNGRYDVDNSELSRSPLGRCVRRWQ
jgi:hypothetical protein